MKRKPMLISKLERKVQGRGREVIGLIGTHRGVGVTYTGLMLAFYMGEEIGIKTAFLECNKHQDMRLIQKAYEWSEEEESFFSFHLITCYKEVTTKHISGISGEDYECLILDFGTDWEGNREEFLRCSTKIVVGGRSEWDIQKLERFAKVADASKGNDSWLYFIPRASDKTVIRIRNEVKHKVWAVPVTEEPVLPTNSSNQFFGNLFRK